MRERIGTIKAHYWSGQIEEVDGREVLESEAEQVIEALPPLPAGSFYDFHALRLVPRPTKAVSRWHV